MVHLSIRAFHILLIHILFEYKVKSISIYIVYKEKKMLAAKFAFGTGGIFYYLKNNSISSSNNDTTILLLNFTQQKFYTNDL